MLLSNACAPDPRVEKEASALAKHGHDVTIVAWDRSRRHTSEEVRDGYRVVRVGPVAEHGGGLRNLPAYRRFWREATSEVRRFGADVVHCHDADTIPAGLAARRRIEGCELILDLHERYSWSRMIPQRGPIGWLARVAVDTLERSAGNKAAFVILANPGTADHYRTFVPEGKLLVVENAPDKGLFKPMECERPRTDFTVLFIGRIRYPRTLEALIDAAQGLNARVVIAGDGPDRERVEAFARKREKVELHGPLPYEEIPSWYACADVVHAAYDSAVGNALVATPGKVLEAMACGKPVIVSEGTWVGTWVAQVGAGLAVCGDDADDVRAALERLADEPGLAAELGSRGRAVIEDGLDWETMSEMLADAYDSLNRDELEGRTG